MVESKLSVDEAELYDRQIRLWGIESQEKLRAANILLMNVRGLGSEIAKNILLSGINSLTILDDGVVTEDDLTKNFLLDKTAINQKIAEAVITKAQALNPLVKITSDTESVDNKNPKYFEQFTIVIGTQLNIEQILRISLHCRKHGVKFIYGDNFGMFGFTMADFQEHQYFEDRVQFVTGQKRPHNGSSQEKKQAERTTVKVAANLSYPSLEAVLKLPEEVQKPKRTNVYYYLMLSLLLFRDKHGRDPNINDKVEDIEILKTYKNKILALYSVNPEKLPDQVFDLIFGEIAPISSIVGGVLAQEVIKAVSGKEVPICNVFLLDPFTYSGREDLISV